MNEFSVFLYPFKSIIGTKKTKKSYKAIVHYDLNIDVMNSEEKSTQ